MSITIKLPPDLEQRILGQAVESKKPVEEIAIGLIVLGLDSQTPKLTFDEILAPFRREITESGISEDELDALFLKARRDYARENEEQD
ncbi:MAG: hypothetical protein KIT57_08540 [Blastocatellales bacterium]|nr:hypothetical protein [Blastocatellales bacterium]